MRTHGNLIKWNEDRGFGFIAPANGGAEVFVHISAFPRNGKRPTLNELVSYETTTTADGKIQASQIMRPGQRNKTKSTQRNEYKSSGAITKFLIIAAFALIGYFGFKQFQSTRLHNASASTASALESAPVKSPFACDGRTKCSQMNSCAEAEYFLTHCPNTEMDGNGDGEPCEQQWCN